MLQPLPAAGQGAGHLHAGWSPARERSPHTAFFPLRPAAHHCCCNPSCPCERRYRRCPDADHIKRDVGAHVAERTAVEVQRKVVAEVSARAGGRAGGGGVAAQGCGWGEVRCARAGGGGVAGQVGGGWAGVPSWAQRGPGGGEQGGGIGV